VDGAVSAEERRVADEAAEGDARGGGAGEIRRGRDAEDFERIWVGTALSGDQQRESRRMDGMARESIIMGRAHLIEPSSGFGPASVIFFKEKNILLS